MSRDFPNKASMHILHALYYIVKILNISMGVVLEFASA